MKDIVLLGPPGSGKGTQADSLVQKFGLKKISTGDLIRDHIIRNTPLGLQVKKVVDAGSLVSDELIGALFEDALRNASNGYIADGFPRTLPQAMQLTTLIEKLSLPKPKVFFLDLDLSVLVKRILGRKSCPTCGRGYNTFFSPPRIEGKCDDDETVLVQRSDDNEEVIRTRYLVFKNEIEPILNYYGEELVAINASQDPKVIFDQISKELL